MMLPWHMLLLKLTSTFAIAVPGISDTSSSLASSPVPEPEVRFYKALNEAQSRNVLSQDDLPFSVVPDFAQHAATLHSRLRSSLNDVTGTNMDGLGVTGSATPEERSRVTQTAVAAPIGAHNSGAGAADNTRQAQEAPSSTNPFLPTTASAGPSTPAGTGIMGGYGGFLLGPGGFGTVSGPLNPGAAPVPTGFSTTDPRNPFNGITGVEIPSASTTPAVPPSTGSGLGPLGNLFGSSLPAVPEPHTGPTAIGGQCKRYTLMAVRGTGEDQSNPSGSKKLVQQVMTTVHGGEAYEVIYPATYNFLMDPEKGVIDLTHYHGNIRKQCPSQRIAMFGYSQGAMVVINALNTDEMKADVGNVRSVVVTGNPYYVSNMSQNRGTAKSGVGIGRIKNIGRGGSTVPPEFVPVTHDYCNEGDPVCQGISISTKGFEAHHYNGTQQEQEFITFTIQRLLA